MPKLKINERSVELLQLEMKELNKDLNAMIQENDALRNQNMMLLESMEALTEDESFWSQEALQTGIVFRLKNVLNQIKQNNG